MVGEKVTLPCVATSAEGTHLSYLWTRNGIPLDVDGERLYYANDTGIVVINGTELGDTGVYQCTVQTTFLNVSSPAPNVSSPFSTVTVYCKPHSLSFVLRLAVLLKRCFCKPLYGLCLPCIENSYSSVGGSEGTGCHDNICHVGLQRNHSRSAGLPGSSEGARIRWSEQDRPCTAYCYRGNGGLSDSFHCVRGPSCGDSE